GLKGAFVDRPDQLGAAWEAAFAADRPFVLEAYTDPDVPPLPPHITLKQAQAFAATLVKGDPSEWKVIKETAKELISDLMPSRS
ncbi:MAG: thiamine pyrophosphate-requiring protein, partial [Alphaproteobacteria bacterium]|nr:thiamine pyrophosphate-requiring protein [Alphaproteobacteria bacterium]